MSEFHTITVSLQNDAVSVRHLGHLRELLVDVDPGVRLMLTPDSARRDDGSDEEAPGHESAIDHVAAGTSDVAWMDMRHLPWPLPDEIRVVACTARRNPREANVHRQGTRFGDLLEGPSLRATNRCTRAQVTDVRPDVEWVDLDGDLPIVLHKLHLQKADAVLASASDLLALGFDERAFEFLSMDLTLPPPGQGAWAICCRQDRDDLASMLSPLDDSKARLCATAELDLAQAVAPTGEASTAAWARLQRGKLMVDACRVDGRTNEVARHTVGGPAARRDDLLDALRAVLTTA